MISLIQVPTNLDLDESKKRQLRRIKEELTDALVRDIRIDILIKEQKSDEYYGDNTAKGLQDLKELSQIEIRNAHNKLTHFVDSAVTGGLDEHEEEDDDEGYSRSEDSNEFDEGYSKE